METSQQDAGVEVRSYFVRNRNALATRSELSSLFVDYYLHLAYLNTRPEPGHDQIMKEALGAMVLHAATRPWSETIAWTLHIEDPALNIFTTASNKPGEVTGQLFSENVKVTGENMIFADVIRGSGPRRRSVTPFEGDSPFAAVEALYRHSEQRPARFFRYDMEDIVMVSAQPDCDLKWLDALDEDAIRRMDQTEELALLETRHYAWRCGCNERRMLEVLATPMKAAPEDLFGDAETVRISCPRCGVRYTISRETMEAHLTDE